MADETVSIRLRLRDGARFAAETRLAKKEIKDLGDEADKAGRKGKKAGKDISIMTVAVRQLAIAGVIAGVALFGKTLVSALAGGGLAAVGLVAALAPLAGLLGALPAAGLLAGQAFGVMAISLQGIGKAVGGLNKAMDPKKFAALSGPGQRLALLLDALKPRVKSLRDSIQNGLFPGLTKGLLAASPALNALRGPLHGTAVVLGAFAAHLGALVGSKGFLSDLSSQARFNNVQIGRLGDGALHLVNVFRNLMVGSRGLVSWIVRMVSGWAATADRMTTASRATGGLRAGFHTVEVTTERVGKLFWRLGVALFNIGRIGKSQIGDGILVYLLKSVTALEHWTRSERGVNQLNNAFAWARRELHQIAMFVSGIASAGGPGFGAALSSLAAALAPLLASKGGATILGLYVRALGDLASVAGFIEQNVPGATSALSALAAVALLNKISKVNLLKVAFKGLGFALLFVTAPAEAAATAFWALDGALAVLFAPITLIIGAIALIALGLYLAYTKVGWFRHGVQAAFKWVKNAIVDVWQWIKTHWHTIGDVLIVPFRPLVAIVKWIIEHFSTIKGLISTIGGFIGSVVGKAGKALGAINPFADGGIVNTPLQLVGERGPELAALPIGSRVFTAAQTVGIMRRSTPHVQHPRRAPVSAAVHRGTHATADRNTRDSTERPIHLHTTNVIEVNGKVLAKVVSDEVAKQAGR